MKPGAVIHGQPGKKETRYLLHVTVTLCNIYTIIYTRDLSSFFSSSSSVHSWCPPELVHLSVFIFLFWLLLIVKLWNFKKNNQPDPALFSFLLLFSKYLVQAANPPLPSPPSGEKKTKTEKLLGKLCKEEEEEAAACWWNRRSQQKTRDKTVPRQSVRRPGTDGCTLPCSSSSARHSHTQQRLKPPPPPGVGSPSPPSIFGTIPNKRGSS